MDVFSSDRYRGDDDHDDFSALDFSVGDDDGGSGLEAFDVYTPVEEDRDPGWAASDLVYDEEPGGEHAADHAEHDEQDDFDGQLFTVTNPAGTVTVSALLDGRVHRIELSPKVTQMTETELADEIVVVARLARQQARSAQYAFVSESMEELGQGRAETRDFLERTMGLPSPEQVQAEAAELFATRYKGDHE